MMTCEGLTAPRMHRQGWQGPPESHPNPTRIPLGAHATVMPRKMEAAIGSVTDSRSAMARAPPKVSDQPRMRYGFLLSPRMGTQSESSP